MTYAAQILTVVVPLSVKPRGGRSPVHGERWLGFSLQRFSSDRWIACQLTRTSRPLP
jgi:hypothetical protein